jgi:hypothetical protein
MTTYAEYFEEHRPKPKWKIGDRVFGRWNKIPFIGTVANDRMLNEEEGPFVQIFLDLPIVVKEQQHNIIQVKQRDIKPLVRF